MNRSEGCPGNSAPAPARAGWDARLDLAFARRGERSTLVRRQHIGPLVVQKTLHPEGPAVCQAIVIHPPGGIVGGDRLAFAVDVDDGAHAQLTTPGATRWYRSAVAARQTLDAQVGEGAVLEWLPQETIVFEGACAESTAAVTLAGNAVFMGWDIVCLGRIASGERFTRGSFRQCFELVRDGALVWVDRTKIDGTSGIAASPLGLNRSPMFGTFVVASPEMTDAVLAACRRTTPERSSAMEGAVTRLPGAFVARCRGHSPEAARQWFAALWAIVRPALCGRAAMSPRIWST